MAFKRDEAYEGQGKFIAWVGWSIVWAIIICWLLLMILLPMTNWIKQGFSLAQLSAAWTFWKQTFNIFQPGAMFNAFGNYWATFKMAPKNDYAMYLPWLSFIIPMIFFVVRIVTNPYKYMPNVFGDPDELPGFKSAPPKATDRGTARDLESTRGLF